MTLAFTITALEGTKMRTEDCHAGESERTSLVPRPGSSQPRMSRPSAGGQRRAPSRTPRVSHVAAMHRLVQGQHEEALPVSGELPLQPLWWRFRRLVEVRFAQRLQQLQVLLAQLTILLPNLGERWIRAGIGDGFRALAKVLLPLRRGILVSEKYRRDRALNQREMTQNPERVTSAVRCRKRRCRAAHLVNYTEHGSVRNSQCEFNNVFRLHFLSAWNCLPLSITAPGRARIRDPATFLRRGRPQLQRSLPGEATDNASSPRCARCADRPLRVEQQNQASIRPCVGAAPRLPTRRPLLQLSVATAQSAVHTSRSTAIRRSDRQSDLRRDRKSTRLNS